MGHSNLTRLASEYAATLLQQRARGKYGKAGFAELAVCISEMSADDLRESMKLARNAASLMMRATGSTYKTQEEAAGAILERLRKR